MLPPTSPSFCRSLRMPVLAAIFENGPPSDSFIAFSTNQLRGMSHGVHPVDAAAPAFSFLPSWTNPPAIPSLESLSNLVMSSAQ